MESEEIITNCVKQLTDDEKKRLQEQDSRLVSEFKANSLENDAKKHWDLFYKRNETRFFKDRHWTTREFQELINNRDSNVEPRVLFEIGCGVGNFIFPLIEEGLNFRIIACDLSPRAVEMVKNHKLYSENRVRVFQSDVTSNFEKLKENVAENSIDIITMIFVLSAIHPEKYVGTLLNVRKLLKPGGLLLFRDYGLYDMAQLRFKAGHKIGDNFYMRQDGTRSYYFSTEFAKSIFEQAGFELLDNSYIHRRTINKKENIDVPRIFLQIKAKNP